MNYKQIVVAIFILSVVAGVCRLPAMPDSGPSYVTPEEMQAAIAQCEQRQVQVRKKLVAELTALAKTYRTPVYRFWSPESGSHFYTVDPNERDKLIHDYPDHWSYEGEVGGWVK